MTWADTMIREGSCHGTLTIDGFPMNRGAWATLNNYVLWEGADTAGEDTLVPAMHGSLPNPRWKQPTRKTLELLIVGTVDRFDVETNDAAVGLEENVTWLQEFVEAPVASLDGTRTLVLTLPSGATRTGEAHVGPMRLGSVIRGAFTATLEVSLPQGELGAPVPADSGS